MSSRSKGGRPKTDYEVRVSEGKRLALGIFRSAVRTDGHIVLDLALALAFDGFPYPIPDARRIPGKRWRFVWRDRRDLDPIAEHVPLNRATVALAVRGHSTVYGISPERLLPPVAAMSPPSAARAYLLELYRADAASLTDEEARRHGILRHLVESEAYTELGRSGPWRSMEEILYEVGLGARLDGLFTNPDGLQYEHVEAAVDAELDALVAQHADAVDELSPSAVHSGRFGSFGKTARRAPRKIAPFGHRTPVLRRLGRS